MSRVRMTKKQKDNLIAYLENHRYVVEGRAANAAQVERYEEKWKELANSLNQIQGARKTVKQWRETLNDFKANVKRRARAKHFEVTGTGGGPSSDLRLKPVEEKLLNIMSPTVISGIAEIPEAGFEQVLEDEQPESSASQRRTTTELVYVFDVVEESITKNFIDASHEIDATIGHERARKPNRKQKRKQDNTFHDVAQKHEECLKVLADSNVKLAKALLTLSRKMKKKEWKVQHCN